MPSKYYSCIGFAVGFAILVAPVRATFHLMQTEQVIGGVNGDATAQAIQLRMRSSFQNFVSGSRIRAWDSAGANPVLVIDFSTNVPNGQGGDRVLVATPSFIVSTSPPAVLDALMTNPIPPSYLPAGSLTFEDGSGIIYWRLSWGGSAYTGSTTGDSTNDDDSGIGPADFGPPFDGPLPSTTLQALYFPGPASALSTSNAADYTLTTDAATFTNNARDSFIVVAPEPGAGDIDGDGVVDSEDLARFVACWGGIGGLSVPIGCTEQELSRSDMDDDGDVDLGDFAEFELLWTPP